MAHPQAADGGGLQVWIVAANVSNKQLWTGDKGRSSSVGLTDPHRKKISVTKFYKGPQTWMDSLNKRHELMKMDMRFGTWNVRSLHRAGSLMTVASEISKYKLDLVGVQVRWGRGGTEPADKYTFFYGKGNETHELGTDFFVSKKIISAVNRVAFASDRMLKIIQRGC
jgi:hypothetical protein